MADYGAMSVTRSLSISTRSQNHNSTMSHMHGVTACGAIDSLYSRTSSMENPSIMDSSDYHPHEFFVRDSVSAHARQIQQQRSEWVTLSKPFLLKLVEKLCQLSFENDGLPCDDLDVMDDYHRYCSSVDTGSYQGCYNTKQSERCSPAVRTKKDFIRNETAGNAELRPAVPPTRSEAEINFQQKEMAGSPTVLHAGDELSISKNSLASYCCDRISSDVSSKLQNKELNLSGQNEEMTSQEDDCVLRESDSAPPDDESRQNIHSDELIVKTALKKKRDASHNVVTSKASRLSSVRDEGISKRKPQQSFYRGPGNSKHISKKTFQKMVGKGGHKKVPSQLCLARKQSSETERAENQQQGQNEAKQGQNEASKQSWVALNKSLVYRMIDEALSDHSVDRNQFQRSAAAFIFGNRTNSEFPDRLRKSRKDRKRLRDGNPEMRGFPNVIQDQPPQLRFPGGIRLQDQPLQLRFPGSILNHGIQKIQESEKQSENVASFMNCEAPLLGALLGCDDDVSRPNPTYSGADTRQIRDCLTAFNLQAASINNNNNNNCLDALISSDKNSQTRTATRTSSASTSGGSYVRRGSDDVLCLSNKNKERDSTSNKAHSQEPATPTQPRWIALDKCEVRSLVDSLVASMMMSDEGIGYPESTRRRSVLSLRNSSDEFQRNHSSSPVESERNNQYSLDGSSSIQLADDVATVRRHSCCSIQKRKKYRLRLCVDPTALRSWIVH